MTVYPMTLIAYTVSVSYMAYSHHHVNLPNRAERRVRCARHLGEESGCTTGWPDTGAWVFRDVVFQDVGVQTTIFITHIRFRRESHTFIC